MEEFGEEACNVVYYCAGAADDEEVYELYHKRSPPDAPPKPVEDGNTLDRVYHNARILLDENQGGYNEIFVSSDPKQCLDRLEIYANDSPTVILVELDGKRFQRSGHAEGDDAPPNKTMGFLRHLSADVQGARFQKHVLPFALTVLDKSSPAEDGLGAAITRDSFTSGALDVMHSPLEHDDVNRLVGHVKELTRPPARLVGAPMAQNLVDSIRDTSTPQPACHRPDQAISDSRKAEIEKAVRQWGFPASQFNMDELTYCVLVMLEHILRHPQLEGYSLPREQLVTFLLATRRQYKHEREVHYHNWRHAVDVTQSIYVFLADVQLCPPFETDGPPSHEPSAVERLLTPLDGLIILISAVGHDVGHPGVNNAFLIACNHPLAQTYNDKSVLENYHCAAYSQLLRRHWPALTNIPSFRSALISTILATDMQRHFEYMSSLNDLKSKVQNGQGNVDDWSDKDKSQTRELVMALLMKAADISNVARPFDISANWAKILMNEFARQGELESELQIPTCLFGGPPNKEDPLAAAQSQKGFMSLFGYPLFKGISEVLPGVSCSILELENNQKTWDQKIEEVKRHREAKPSHEELHLSSVSAKEVEQATSNGLPHKSEPAVIPASEAQRAASPLKRSTATSPETSPSKHSTQALRQHLTDGVFLDGEKRASAPFLASAGVQLSPSRRSSKDVALDHYQQLHAFAQQNLESGSRRGSADASFQIHQSYPGSRRGSKDEALTVIHVTPGRQSSPSSPGKRVSPSKPAGGKRQSVPTNPKQSAATRTSFPSSRSHATSSATAATSQDSPSVSTQPSSVAHEDDQPTPPGRSASIAATEDPFIAPGSWPNDMDGAHRVSSPGDDAQPLPSTPPPPPVNGTAKPDNPPIITRLASNDTDDRGTPRKPSGIRESRSRSRLRGLKFWKKKNRDASGVGVEQSHPAGSTTSVGPDSPARS